MPHFPNILGKWGIVHQESGAQFIKAFISQGSMSNEFMYVVDAHFIDKIEKMISWTQVPVVHIITRVCKLSTGTCFIQKIYAPPPSSLLQGTHLPFSPFPSASAQYFSLICDPFADPIISLHSRDISLFNCHI